MRDNLLSMCLSVVLFMFAGLGCFGGGAISGGDGAPTKSDIKETLIKRTRSIYLTDTQKSLYKIADVKLDFDDSSIKIGSPVEKQVEFGVSGTKAYPVKVNYTITTTYTDDREPKTEEVGEGIVEYFYKDGFGEWQARYGRDS